MATWIAHLRLAENLLARIPDLDEGQFAIGNIAPDSGVPDEKWEHFDPPKEVTHFLRPGDSESDIHDLEFYRVYLAAIDPQDTGRFSMRLGYFFHLLADQLWSNTIGRRTEERYSAEFNTNPEFIWKIKGDWYGLDLIHVRDHPHSLFWRVFLGAQPDALDLNFLPRPAVEHQLNYIKTFYQRRDEEIQKMVQRPFDYLSKAEMDGFVADSAERIFLAYQLLWPKRPQLSGKHSVLQIA